MTKEEKLDTIINTLTLAFYEAKASSVCKKHCGDALVKLREFREPSQCECMQFEHIVCKDCGHVHWEDKKHCMYCIGENEYCDCGWNHE